MKKKLTSAEQHSIAGLASKESRGKKGSKEYDIYYSRLSKIANKKRWDAWKARKIKAKMTY